MWLAENVGKELGGGQSAAATLVTANIPFTISRQAAREHLVSMLSSGADVVVLQEVRNLDVRGVAERHAPGAWEVYHPPGGTAVMWRTSTCAPGVEDASASHISPDAVRRLVAATSTGTPSSST